MLGHPRWQSLFSITFLLVSLPRSVLLFECDFVRHLVLWICYQSLSPSYIEVEPLQCLLVLLHLLFNNPSTMSSETLLQRHHSIPDCRECLIESESFLWLILQTFLWIHYVVYMKHPQFVKSVIWLLSNVLNFLEDCFERRIRFLLHRWLLELIHVQF